MYRQMRVWGSKTTLQNTKLHFCFTRCGHRGDKRISRFGEKIYEFIFGCVDFEMFVGSSSEDILTFG